MSLINVSPYDMWRHEKLPIFIRSSAQNEAVDRVNEDRTALIKLRSWHVVLSHVDALDSPRRLTAIGRRKPTDREIMAHDHHAIMAHDQRVIVAINGPSTGSNGPRFLQEILFKNRCSSLVFLTFDRFVKQLREFEG